MPNYRRAHVPGGTFFFTVVTHRRRRLFHVEANRTLLGEVMRECQRDWPFEMNAVVLLPDHLHAIWTLPPGDDDYSDGWLGRSRILAFVAGCTGCGQMRHESLNEPQKIGLAFEFTGARGAARLGDVFLFGAVL